MAQMSQCVYCKGDVDLRPGHHFQRVVGWERKALADGRRSGSDIVCRERREEFACNGCVSLLKDGITPGQGVLI